MLFSSPVSFLCRKKSAFSAYSVVWFKYAIWCMKLFIPPLFVCLSSESAACVVFGRKSHDNRLPHSILICDILCCGKAPERSWVKVSFLICVDNGKM